MFATIRTSLRERLASAATSARARTREHGRRDEGFLLIEVVISAVLVGLVVIATFTGFDVINRTSTDQRRHNQGSLLAAQSQEQLRSDPSTALDLLEKTPHVYTKEVAGTVYTITQKATPVSGTTGAVGCSNEKGSTTSGGTYLEVSSVVTWPQLVASKRPGVSESSIITPPDGSGLEVDVSNGGTPEAPVSGVNVTAEYTGNESELPSTVEAKTGEKGCALFTGIPSTTATVEASQGGFVTPSGAFVFGPQEVTIAPNITTHTPVELAEGGAIQAKFTYEGKESYTYPGGKLETVKGDTFVVFNHAMGVAPEFEVGSTKITVASNGTYEAQTGTSTAGTYAAVAKTPVSATHYVNGDLFPFTSAWAVYAGDCLSNNPELIASKPAADGSAKVLPKTTTEVSVPMSYLRVTVYSGTSASHSAATEALPVKITNVSCQSSPTPNNASGLIKTHTQSTTSPEGHLEDPFQPFGKFELCIASAKEKKKYTAKYATETVKGPAELTIFLKESLTEKTKGTNKEITVTEGSSTC